MNVPEKASHEAIHVYNAIMLLATAIKNIHDQYCDVAGICPNLYNEATGRTLLSYLLNASFVDEFHQTFELFNRSATPVYNVSQMQDVSFLNAIPGYGSMFLGKEFRMRPLQIDLFLGDLDDGSI